MVQACVCWLPSGFESVYRTGLLLRSLFEATPTRRPSGTLPAAPPTPVTAELVELTRRLRDSGRLANLHDLSGDPASGQRLMAPV